MKKAFLLLLLCSCQSKTTEFDRTMSDLSCPVILIGKTINPKLYSSIVVKDGSGRIATFTFIRDQGTGLGAAAIADSREIGDTIKNDCIH